MIPQKNVSSPALRRTFTVAEPTSKTYRMNLGGDTIAGTADGKEAMKQAIFKTLSTERYEYIIYSDRYGAELSDLFGESIDYVKSEIKRRITEALLADSRIKSVDGFVFSQPSRHALSVSFTAATVFGDIETEKEVKMSE